MSTWAPLKATSSNLFKRGTSTTSSSTATDSNGCVVCPSDSPDCPTCASNEDCALTIQTCNTCPKTYCKSTGSSSGGTSGKEIGGIVGGVLGGLVLMIIIGGFFFYRYYKQKVMFNRVHHKKEPYFDDDVEINFRHQRSSKVPSRGIKPQGSRSSMAASVITRASNIIPIAYIPGVTIGASTNNNRMSRADSDIGTLDSELIGDRLSKASVIGTPSQTTTAIRARPKLINVHDSIGQRKGRDDIPRTAVGVSHLGGVRSVKVVDKRKKLNTTLQEEPIEEESDLESMATHDITKRMSYEPFIIDDSEEDERDDELDTQSTHKETKSLLSRTNTMASEESRGSVLLDVEIDRAPLNPFDDPNTTKNNET